MRRLLDVPLELLQAISSWLPYADWVAFTTACRRCWAAQLQLHPFRESYFQLE
ncbi:hypothetical protein HDU91_001205, partial [Kappamyces sp. JEL0680]